jgi:hypothetical protein
MTDPGRSCIHHYPVEHRHKKLLAWSRKCLKECWSRISIGNYSFCLFPVSFTSFILFVNSQFLYTSFCYYLLFASILPSYIQPSFASIFFLPPESIIYPFILSSKPDLRLFSFFFGGGGTSRLGLVVTLNSAYMWGGSAVVGTSPPSCWHR